MQHLGRPLREGEEPIKIGFVGFHSDFFASEYNSIVLMLRDHFPIAVVNTRRDEVPDHLFFSVYGYQHREPRFDRCQKIFTCEENIRIPWADCDYAVTGDRLTGAEEHHLRVPIYVRTQQCAVLQGRRGLVKDLGRDPREVLLDKTGFCNFIYSNIHSKPRVMFFEELSRYKKVDSGGRSLNNIHSTIREKLPFINQYKFTIAFENSRGAGYVTEKIVEPMLVDSVPIYWGDRRISQEFNPASFVDANEPEGRSMREHFKKVVEEVARLDQDDEAYLRMVSEPWFHENRPNLYCEPDYVVPFFKHVFSTPREEYGRQRNLQRKPPQSWQELEGRDWMKPGYDPK